MKMLLRLAVGAAVILGAVSVDLSVAAAASPQSTPVGHDSQQPGSSFWLASPSGAVWNLGTRSPSVRRQVCR